MRSHLVAIFAIAVCIGLAPPAAQAVTIRLTSLPLVPEPVTPGDIIAQDMDQSQRLAFEFYQVFQGDAPSILQHLLRELHADHNQDLAAYGFHLGWTPGPIRGRRIALAPVPLPPALPLLAAAMGLTALLRRRR